ncbi:hypothetical protein CDAR_74941 [Caerostris darwini]|uniref:Uncharacterized protein n=1 Tax=Caerostris darwini TaxID=1538125 RepID=A0AAV4P1M9_9ARAC|nr:hypothetical protein CDAR_74941 [Caerostris darwini]
MDPLAGEDEEVLQSCSLLGLRSLEVDENIPQIWHLHSAFILQMERMQNVLHALIQLGEWQNRSFTSTGGFLSHNFSATDAFDSASSCHPFQDICITTIHNEDPVAHTQKAL